LLIFYDWNGLPSRLSHHIIAVLTRFHFDHIFVTIDSSLNCFMKFSLPILILSVILFSNCKKSGKDDDNPGGALNVYLAGGDKTGDGSLPCYWKNDTRTNLSNTAGGDACSIVVDGQNVYVSGRTWTDNAQTRFSPCYWLNGTRKDLPLLDTRGNGTAKSILAFNGTVYAAGTCSDSLEFFGNSGWRNIPCYWKNGKIIRLEMLDGSGNGSTESITLVAAPNRTITYIVGTSTAPSGYGYDEPCYWKIDPNVITTPDADIEGTALSNKGYGGTAKNVSPGKANQAQNDVYIAGFVDNADGYNDPCYWHNGTRIDLSKISPLSNGVANAIDAGNDVYVAGYVGNSTGAHVPCIWKNGTRTDLMLPAIAHSGEATSCRVNDGNVYVAGTINTDNGEFPCYWKNGELVQYKTKGTANSITLGN
jgi:hypothetical protein